MAEGARQLVEVDGRRMRLTNLDKVMYPETGMTKGEVISYYAEVAPVMVPLVAGRPVTRKRWVHGVGTPDAPQPAFFEKNFEHAPDWVRTGVIRHSDGPKTYPIAGDRATLVWLAQLAALELHVPQWRFDARGEPGNPDRMVFDLDPGEGMGLADCAEVARLVRDLVSGMGLEAMPVTSGSKGIHLYTALDGRQTSDQVSQVAHELARALEADHPELIVSSMRKTLRGGRVLIDWSQNNGKKTTIAPYSLRGRFRPTVAAPRTWAELEDPDLRHLEAHEVLERVASGDDPLAVITAASHDGPLAEYLSMRKTGVTPEPMPSSSWGRPSDGDPRFVIQEHHARRLHFDLRLERDGVLKSWAVPKGVPDDAGVEPPGGADRGPSRWSTPTFEGTIPAGEYGAGSMTIWDSGTYETEKWRDDEVIIDVDGQPGGPLGGRVRLALIRTDGSGEKSSWLLHRMKDQRPGHWGPTSKARHANEPAADAASTDAASDAPPADTAAEPSAADPDAAGATPPTATPPRPRTRTRTTTTDRTRSSRSSCAPCSPPPARSAWWRAATGRSSGSGTASACSRAPTAAASGCCARRGNDVTATYPELAGLPRVLRGDALVDGEIVALDDQGRPSFERMQQRMNLARPREIERLWASCRCGCCSSTCSRSRVPR